MAYEVFKRTGVRVESPALSIVPDGRIAINAAAARCLTERGIKSVVLLWDRTNHKMAIKAAQKGDTDAYAVSISGGKYSGSLRARAFITHIGWSAPKRERIPTTWNEKEKMFELTLPEKFLESR
ncbi:MAG: hypothetical protein ABSG07_22480 [Terriglobales bacterium]|jgi:hypothetical protein